MSQFDSTSDDDEDWSEEVTSKSTVSTTAHDTRSCCDQQLDSGLEFQFSKYGHSRAIVHIDIDCFYAQVEMMRNPELRDKPLGIQQKNIIVTCNYVARKQGVTKLMYLKDAIAKCPSLRIVNGEDLTHYREMSYLITGVLSKYSDAVERLGFDENMLLVPPWNRPQEKPAGHVYGQDSNIVDKAKACSCGCVERLTVASHIAEVMRKSLLEELGITGCAGIGHNKIMAKLVGETHKPNQQTVLYTHHVQGFMCGLGRLSRIPGIGHKTSNRLASLGINSVSELQSCPINKLTGEFGEATGKTLIDLSRGVDDSVLVNTGKPQSMSDEDSFRKCDTVQDAKHKISQLLDNLLKRVSQIKHTPPPKWCILAVVSRRLESDGRIPQTLRVTVRKLVPGVKYPNRQSRQGPIPTGTFKEFLKGHSDDTQDKLLALAMKLFEKAVDVTQKFHLTLINVCFSNLVEEEASSVAKKGSIDGFFKSPARAYNSKPQTSPTETASSINDNKNAISRIETDTDVKIKHQQNAQKASGIKGFFSRQVNSKDVNQDQKVQEPDRNSKHGFQTKVTDSVIKNTAKLHVEEDNMSSIDVLRLSNHTADSSFNENVVKNVSRNTSCIDQKDGDNLNETKVRKNSQLKREAVISASDRDHKKRSSCEKEKLESVSSISFVNNNTLNTDTTVSEYNNILLKTEASVSGGDNSLLRDEAAVSVSDKNSPPTNTVTVSELNLINPEDYRYLVKNLTARIDVSTFLELPLELQEEIVLQDGSLGNPTVQRIMGIVKSSRNVIAGDKRVNNVQLNKNDSQFLSSGSGMSYSSLRSSDSGTSDQKERNLLNYDQICDQITDNFDNGNKSDVNTKPALIQNVNKTSLLQDTLNNNEEKLLKTAKKLSQIKTPPSKSSDQVAIDTLLIPPGIDPEVFRELPPDVRRSLSREWNTEREFESMRKRKLCSPEGLRSSKRRNSSDISSFFKKK